MVSKTPFPCALDKSVYSGSIPNEFRIIPELQTFICLGARGPETNPPDGRKWVQRLKDNQFKKKKNPNVFRTSGSMVRENWAG